MKFDFSIFNSLITLKLGIERMKALIFIIQKNKEQRVRGKEKRKKRGKREKNVAAH